MFKEDRELIGSTMTARTDAQVAKVKKVLDFDRLHLTYSCFREWKESSKGIDLTPLRRFKQQQQRLSTVFRKKGFQRAFDEWQMWWTKCIDAGGMYFENIKVIVMIPAINFDIWNQSRYLLNGPCNMPMLLDYSILKLWTLGYTTYLELWYRYLKLDLLLEYILNTCS